MAYLEPTDTLAIKRIGITVAALIAVTVVLIGIVNVVL